MIHDCVAIFTEDPEPLGRSIVFVNAQFLRMSGYTSEQLVGHSALLLAGKRPELRHVHGVLFSSANDHTESAARKHRPDGSCYEVSVQVDAVRGSDGRVTHRILRERLVAEGCGCR